jgi:hypothetical protein
MLLSPSWIAFTLTRYFLADEFSVAARVGICVLAFLFGLLLMWVTEPFFGDHLSDTQKEIWIWPLRIAAYGGLAVVIRWLARRKAIRIANRASTMSGNDA